ncbi:hypothetical protein [Edaphobacter sp.]|uniref:hypothetical protein n=1 Tax=Edaphobacter sp. TaxID=1934404 RepID=UPI002DB602C4|nr:hypothetical protein [Edaphobacter sp.]HEU5341254.1 hypothetical protein [Edaphobacter sp.]
MSLILLRVNFGDWTIAATRSKNRFLRFAAEWKYKRSAEWKYKKAAEWKYKKAAEWKCKEGDGFGIVLSHP